MPETCQLRCMNIRHSQQESQENTNVNSKCISATSDMALFERKPLAVDPFHHKFTKNLV